MTAIDLNADVGEGDACDVELLSIVSSCNIACGGHAGDAASMAETIRTAMANSVAIGAHPSYPDREGFGRRSGYVTGDVLSESLREQIQALRTVAHAHGTELSHVKPHGALYNDAAADRTLAELVVQAVAGVHSDFALVGPPGSKLSEAAADCHMPYVAEAFIDRAYCIDGSLVPRSEHGAVHIDIENIAAQAVSLALRGELVCQSGQVIEIVADTLCIHGDTDGAAGIARAVVEVLRENGVAIHARR
ncbi:MAG: 5-oxoprolinase subunit PxpA [Proteobacteria bacterium]|nr:5-oxoprolinase subunit PxpA [Pseudomonadota bacterium]